jgi:hypothetical protein
MHPPYVFDPQAALVSEYVVWAAAGEMGKLASNGNTPRIANFFIFKHSFDNEKILAKRYRKMPHTTFRPADATVTQFPTSDFPLSPETTGAHHHAPASSFRFWAARALMRARAPTPPWMAVALALAVSFP